MGESLEAACGQFEQVILEQMLRTAGFGRSKSTFSAQADDDATDSAADREPSAADDAFSQLVVRSLSGALERAGGIGLAHALATELERRRQ